MGQHDVSRPGRRTEAGMIKHYQYRTLEQVRRKASNGTKAYSATNLPHFYGTHWRNLNSLDEDGLAGWWEDYTSQPLEYAP